MPRFDLLRRPQPLIALLLVAAGWTLSHQIGSESVFDGCSDRGGGFVALVSLLGLAITLGGGWYGWTAGRTGAESGRGFLGLATALLSLIAGFAIVLQLIAGLILPSCAA